MNHRVLAAMAALAVLATPSCDRDAPPATPAPTLVPATPARVAPATAAATAASTPPPPSTARPTPAPLPATSAAAPTPVPSPAATPTPEPAPPVVTTAGPLLVVSERLARPDAASEGQGETWRVYVYDLGLGLYWAALDYRRTGEPSVQLAGRGLIVWSDGRVRRVDLTGDTEATLLEGWIESVRVSPDGAKVALMLGGPPTILVLDVASGEELLRAAGEGSLLAPLREATSEPRPSLGAWSHDSTALSVVWGERTALLSLSGDLRVLPDDWHVSPHLRYALRLGESAGRECFNRHDCRETWEGFDVIEVATGDVLWSVPGAGGRGLTSYAGYVGDGWWRPGGPGWSGEPRLVAFTQMAGGSQVFDAASGETYPLQDHRNSVHREARGLLEGGAWSNCLGEDRWDHSRPCEVWYNERLVWEGARGWTQYIGFVESARGLALPEAGTMEIRPEPPAGEPPAREEMVGPLLLYASWGGATYADEGSDLDAFAVSDVEAVATWRVMAHDEGTGRSWPVLQHHHHFSWRGLDWGGWGDRVQGARGGLVAGGPGGLRYVAPDGQAERFLTERRPAGWRVSPDGRRVAARFHGGGRGPDGRYDPPRTVVFDIPSGEEILRVVHDEIPAAVGLPRARDAWTVWGRAWTSDSGAVVFDVVDDRMGYGGPTVGVVGRLDGTLHLIPCPVELFSASARCYSPDVRHVVRGRQAASGDYTGSNWRSIDVIAVGSGDVVRSVESPVPIGEWDWEWASADHFAWSDALLPRVYTSEFSPHARAGKDADVSVLDIRTGETVMMGIEDYLARFHPPARAITDCPENPGHPCRILLDGEVAGEGRWPTIIGFVELDDDATASALPYNKLDTTGEAMTPGSYAFLATTTGAGGGGEGSPAAATTNAATGVRVITTWKGLRGDATGLRIHQADASGVSRASTYAAVEVGDAFEWRRASDCWISYRVSKLMPDPPGPQPRKHFELEPVGYAYTGCSGAITADAAVEAVWGEPPARGGAGLAAPVVYGVFQIVPEDWTGELDLGWFSVPPGDPPDSADDWVNTRSLTEARKLPYWRDLPGWVFERATSGGMGDPVHGYCARFRKDSPAHSAVEVCGWHAAAQGAPIRTTDRFGATTEVRFVNGHPALVYYFPRTSPNWSEIAPVRVTIYDAATQSFHEIDGWSENLSGSNVEALLAVARTMFPAR